MRNKEAFVLMTAMPPTKGHKALIEFAANLANANIIICTQPDEPFVKERQECILEFNQDWRIRTFSYNKPIQQNPLDENDHEFWQNWVNILKDYGLREGDYIVGSEEYCKTLAEYGNCIYIPYDIERSMYPARAELVRLETFGRFDWILPSFQKHLRKTITLFGAESCGKTTMTKKFAQNGPSLPEWARPYLESLGSPAVTNELMHNIWQGQKALQKSRHNICVDHPFVFQDTDLFSTLGYWRMYDEKAVPRNLVFDALELKSDLYVVCPSDIPFEPDPLRYGGAERESTDQYWIDLLEEFELPYIILQDRENYMDVALEFFSVFMETKKPLTDFKRER